MEPSRPKFFKERPGENGCDKPQQGVGRACEDLLESCKMQIRPAVSKLPDQVTTNVDTFPSFQVSCCLRTVT